MICFFRMVVFIGNDKNVKFLLGFTFSSSRPYGVQKVGTAGTAGAGQTTFGWTK